MYQLVGVLMTLVLIEPTRWGRSGGLLNIWDNRLFSSIEVISSKHYLINIGILSGIQSPIVFANIHGPQPIIEKKTLWNELLNIRREKDRIWVMIGDFNAVRRSEERFNSGFCSREARDFNRFKHEAGLVDINIEGHWFTCFHNKD